MNVDGNGENDTDYESCSSISTQRDAFFIVYDDDFSFVILPHQLNPNASTDAASNDNEEYLNFDNGDRVDIPTHYGNAMFDLSPLDLTWPAVNQ